MWPARLGVVGIVPGGAMSVSGNSWVLEPVAPRMGLNHPLRKLFMLSGHDSCCPNTVYSLNG